MVTNKSVKDFEIEIEQKNGTRKNCLISANMIHSEAFTGYSGVLRDVTEQQKAEELRKARDIARQSSKMKEQFIENISHEMRTPMNAILGMSNLVMRTPLNPEQAGYINSIKQSSEILLEVVNDILAVSEIQNSQIEFDYKFFNLYELLNNLMNVLQYRAKEKKLSLSLNIAENVPKVVNGDQKRLNQIIYNLVLNAIQFTNEGGIDVSIENLHQSHEFVHLKFTISDTGIGIPADKIAAIFETFTLLRQEGRSQQGTGLGLPIAKTLIEQQGGKIGVESSIGKGSVFFFDLLFEIGELVIPSAIRTKSETALNREALRLLLVEDHKMNQIVAIKTLEKYWDDIIVLVANDGE